MYAMLMAVALVYLGEHYFIDIVAGFLTAAAFWYLVDPRRAGRRNPGPDAVAASPA
jgi:membrane-associated phospholipid phosphatase